jgi:hypothetical protein
MYHIEEMREGVLMGMAHLDQSIICENYTKIWRISGTDFPKH